MRKIALHWQRLIAIILAALVGSVCFAIGFLGPVIFRPEANQGPLLGVFYTGPWGVTAGLLLGLVIGRRNQEP